MRSNTLIAHVDITYLRRHAVQGGASARAGEATTYRKVL